ncbi:hypothetical protein VF21_00894 [Pseudogymnoascus sp. 05NY08]|nr:hypothetical protein VF21_00894 [Pseudogymnoascus sp. 05NY08]
MPTLADQSCLRCRTQKRKCDKLLPTCSLCKRLNKPCSHPAHPDHPETPRLLPLPELLDLTSSNLRYTLEAQVSSVVGDGLKVREAAQRYFRTVHAWLPVVEERGYYARQSRYRVEDAPSDFSVLTLCIFLVCAMPVDGEMTLETRRLYILIKSWVGMLEAMGMNTLAMLQSRLLITTFEIGHAMYPAAYISAGANIQAAIALGASAASFADLSKAFPDPQVMFKLRVAFYRYASLESSTGHSPSLGRSIEAICGNNSSKDLAQMDPFTKMAYSSLLLDQVLAHIHERTSQEEFRRVEAMQILHSLTLFLASFEGEGNALKTLSDSSLAIGRSAMLEVLEFGSKVEPQDNEYCVQASLNILASVTHEIAHGARRVTIDSAALATLPVFIPHCIYKAAIVCLHDAKVFKDSNLKLRIQPLKDLLGYIGLRWGAAKYYVEKIEEEQNKINL